MPSAARSCRIVRVQQFFVWLPLPYSHTAHPAPNTVRQQGRRLQSKLALRMRSVRNIAEGGGDIFSQKIFALRCRRRRNIVVDVCENFVRNSCYENRRFEVVALVRVQRLHPQRPTHSPMLRILPSPSPEGKIMQVSA